MTPQEKQEHIEVVERAKVVAIGIVKNLDDVPTDVGGVALAMAVGAALFDLTGDEDTARLVLAAFNHEVEVWISQAAKQRGTIQ